jgi:hypothetical protein
MRRRIGIRLRCGRWGLLVSEGGLSPISLEVWRCFTLLYYCTRQAKLETRAMIFDYAALIAT